MEIAGMSFQSCGNRSFGFDLPNPNGREFGSPERSRDVP
jgi:hypothetical protein